MPAGPGNFLFAECSLLVGVTVTALLTGVSTDVATVLLGVKSSLVFCGVFVGVVNVFDKNSLWDRRFFLVRSGVCIGVSDEVLLTLCDD